MVFSGPLQPARCDDRGDYFLLDCFSPGVQAAFTTRAHTRETWEHFLNRLRLSPSSLCRIRQTHSALIYEALPGCRPDPDMEGDGLVTRERGAALGILTADCIPAFFWDPERKAAALIHAGWRGVHQGILAAGVRFFRESFQSLPADLEVAFGPAIRECCYEVGPEFEGFFPGYYRPATSHLDLVGAAAAQLAAEGVPQDHLFDTGLCTACLKDRFYSYRAEKTQERLLSVVSIL